MENGKPNTLVQFIVYIVEPLKVLFFNVLIYFLGFKYGGKEGSPIYSIIIILSFATSILLFLKTNSIKKLSSKNLFFFFLVFLFTLFGFAIFGILYSFSYDNSKYFFFFVLFSVPSILWGLSFSKDYKTNIFFLRKWFEPVSYVICLFSILAILIPAIKGNSIIRGDSYQSNSYYAAFAFGMMLYYFSTNIENRFKVFTSIIFKIINVLFICIMPVCSIASGGKGGLVLIAVYFIVFLILSLKSKEKNKTLKLLFTFGLVFSLLFVGLYLFKNSSFFSSRLESVVSYLDFNNFKIDFSQTSNRDLTYSEALILISDNLAFGYSAYAYMPLLTTVNSYPHNFFLEVLLQGGLFLFFIVISLIFTGIKRYKVLKKSHNYTEILLYLFLYPFVMLMFSGSYLINGLFWLVVSILIGVSINEFKNKKSDI